MSTPQQTTENWAFVGRLQYLRSELANQSQGNVTPYYTAISSSTKWCLSLRTRRWMGSPCGWCSCKPTQETGNHIIILELTAEQDDQLENLGMEKQEVVISPLHGTDSPVFVEAQYGLHLSLSQLKVKHLHRKEKYKPGTTAHVQNVKQQLFCQSPGSSPGCDEVWLTLGSRSRSSGRGSAEAPGEMMTWWLTRLQASSRPVVNLRWDLYLRRCFFVLLSYSFNGGLLQQGGVFWFSPADEKQQLVKPSNQMICELSTMAARCWLTRAGQGSPVDCMLWQRCPESGSSQLAFPGLGMGGTPPGETGHVTP